MKTAGTQRCHEMVQLGGGKRPAKKKKHLAENSDERAGKMGLTWGEALAIAQVTAQDRVEWRRFDCGLLFQPE